MIMKKQTENAQRKNDDPGKTYVNDPQEPNYYCTVNRTEDAKVQSGQADKLLRRIRKKTWIFYCILLLFICASLTFSVMTYAENKASVGHRQQTYKTCSEWNKVGYTRSGVYKIQPEERYPEYEVYCDMTSDGGGWTLVASVHEDSAYSSCSIYDRWTVSIPPSFSRQTNLHLWSNGKVTGKLEEATSDDFKSKAYFEKASDVLISHVPNDTPIEEVEDASFLKYHTYDHFLDKFGSSLRSFYRDHAPMKTLGLWGISERVIALIKQNGGITPLVTDWHRYSYDAGTGGSYIRNGGKNMFVRGNEVFFSVNDEPYKQITYGKSYTDSTTYHISSAATQPFIVLASVTSEKKPLTKFRIKVKSTADSGSYKRVYISTYYGNYYLSARSHNIYDSKATRPTICKLFFYIKGYVGVSSFGFNFPTERPTGTNITFEMTANRNPKNVFMGYMLLSRLNGTPFEKSEILELLKKVADYADSVNLFELNGFPPSFSYPVKYLKGKTSYKSRNVTSGFLQLRLFDKQGIPYAMCPGIRLSANADPGLYCIGSSRKDRTIFRRCGDFAAWEQLPEHTELNRLSNDSKTFVNDMSSTILIFTR